MSSDFDTTKMVRARRVRTCEECHQDIQPREQYYRRAGKYEGIFYCISNCSSCQLLGLRLLAYQSAVGYEWDELGHTLGSLLEECSDNVFDHDAHPMPEELQGNLRFVGGNLRERLLIEMSVLT